jgi:23S rRNA pseudouridine1911/1915/1917 synthase
MKITIEKEDLENFSRLDKFLSEKLTDQSRSVIKQLFESGEITSDNHKLTLKKMPAEGVVININIPEAVDTELKAENIPLDILFEDEHLLIINKPAGMVVHPAPGNYTGTLVNAVLFHCDDLKGIGGEKRPGIVHRLDKGTTGVMAVAKSAKAHEGMSNLFATHNIDRIYETIVPAKAFPLTGRIESTIGRHPTNRLKQAINVKAGKHAVTHFRKLETYGPFHHIECQLETGRTHQIRVHLSVVERTPILFDSTYGNPNQDILRLQKEIKTDNKFEYEFPLLHAKTLGFVHPITKEKLHFNAPRPKFFQELLDQLQAIKSEE